MHSSVLIVDDDPRVARSVAIGLGGRGFEVRTANGMDSAMTSLRARRPALVIADLEMPGLDGLALCRRMREISTVPIIALSWNTDYQSEVAALDAGADDYVPKPLVIERLLARVRVALRRNPDLAEAPLGIGQFHIDFDDHRVRVNGEPVHLTPKEFDLFAFMARHPNRVLPHRTLLGAVWGESSLDQSEYLRVFVRQLRKKLESDPARPRHLVTEPWVGYRFNPTGLVQ